MEFICHRVNKEEDLLEQPEKYGVEIDLRDNLNGSIYLEHDPFKLGEDFEDYLKKYKHGTIICNIKSERIELKVIELLKKYKIKQYFFLDSSFPMIKLLSDLGERNIALRYSEFEGMDTIHKMAGKVDWIWVDCFTKMPLTKENFRDLKDMGYKICFVSPELQGQDNKIEEYKNRLKELDIVLDAVCCKRHNINRWIGDLYGK